MGNGTFSRSTYSTARASRLTSGVDDFEYSKQATPETPVHANLNPMRIKNKPIGKLESRDSEEHPDSNAVLLTFDVTGSNIENAKEAQKKLPNLMAMLTKYLPDPQLAVAANDDIHVEHRPTQISDFESDNRVDEHIRNILLTSNGGGNDGESYDLVMWGGAYLTDLDCFNKRGRKGYFFMYADEPIFMTTSPEHVRRAYGINIQESVPIQTTIRDLKNLYHVFVLWPQDGFKHARDQYVSLFGADCVKTLQSPKMICEMVGSLVAMTEGRIGTSAELRADLIEAGTTATEADLLARDLFAGRNVRLGSASA